jgi:hypothetical protein
LHPFATEVYCEVAYASLNINHFLISHSSLLFLRPFASIPFLTKLLIPQELGVHASCAHVLGTLTLLDTVGVSLLRVVVGARVLLL